jgi:hypothetical protein
MPRGAPLIILAALLFPACGGQSTTTTVTVLDGGRAEPAAPVTVTVVNPATTTSAPIGGESATASETTAVAPADTISLVDAGFSVDDKDVGIGVLLHNDSAQDAHGVAISINVLNSADDILKTESNTISLIPAGATVAFGADTFLTEKGKPTKLEVTTTPTSFEGSGGERPTIRRVRIANQEFLGVRVTGEVRNTTSAMVSSIASIYIVLLDGKGKVSGGGFTFLPNDLKPGARAAFDAGNGVSATPRARARKAIVTIDDSPF